MVATCAQDAPTNHAGGHPQQAKRRLAGRNPSNSASIDMVPWGANHCKPGCGAYLAFPGSSSCLSPSNGSWFSSRRSRPPDMRAATAQYLCCGNFFSLVLSRSTSARLGRFPFSSPSGRFQEHYPNSRKPLIPSRRPLHGFMPSDSPRAARMPRPRRLTPASTARSLFASPPACPWHSPAFDRFWSEASSALLASERPWTSPTFSLPVLALATRDPSELFPLWVRLRLGDFVAFVAAGDTLFECIVSDAAMARLWSSYLATLFNQRPDFFRIVAPGLAEDYIRQDLMAPSWSWFELPSSTPFSLSVSGRFMEAPAVSI